ncbi:pseudouridine synthase [Emericellopsis atlantica]|uniref:Pseudouridine synthase n=1 Tax=Emericellopsis atlantica TaxID=2614577 RepID=A0A9P8CNR4_9HYPO|nr:pseudouridine synthase [Emericellopsis atlantica]KAG9253350.1 pseudouridine synthase [Emericellopsis atlantica]
MGDRGSASHMRKLGITQRATPLAVPWTGDLRVRFTDFLVNEITLDGKVAHLRTIGQGEELEQAQKAETEATPPQPVKEEPAAEQPPLENPDIAPEDSAILAELGGEQFAKDIVLIWKSAHEPDAASKKATAESTDDREKRGKLHQHVRRIFKSTIDTSTGLDGAIVASLASKKGTKRSRNGRKKEDRPPKEYLHFNLHKDNRDTMDAINQLGRLLNVKPQFIGYAGTKDRRASTVQRCSLRHIRPKTLSAVNGRLRGVVTGDYEYRDERIHLGGLMGNQFVITIKNCQLLGDAQSKPLAERLEVLNANCQSAVQNLSKHGWINYFGHQRFGTHAIGTHEIGKFILGEKYEEAVNMLLSYNEEIANKAETGDIPEENSYREEYRRHQACMLFLTGKDPSRAEKTMPRRFGAECSLLRHLNRAGDKSRRDFVGALIHITRGLRTMYLHAYQSHVWNHVASKRWELHGNKVVEGDLILVETPVATAPEQDQDGGDVVNPVEEDSEPRVHARPLTAEEATSGNYTIHDVVLPSPGYDMIYPSNAIGEYYTEFMSAPENGALDPHKMRRIRREFSLPGRYRKFMNKFLNDTASVEIKTYTDDTEQMHPTDLDLLKAAKDEDGEPARKKVKQSEDGDAAKPEDPANGEAETVGKADEVEKKIAAVVKFQLGSSAYATVTLRELMGDPPEVTAEA